jgi:predicted nucleic acid-binding protein
MKAGGFLLDTNVVSELVAAAPARQVLRWMVAQVPAKLFLSVITLGEIAKGGARLDAGRRRDRLARWLAEDLPAQFEDRLLPFDQAMAIRWGEMMAESANRARPRPAVDLQIAATAGHLGLGLVTRNIADFEGLGLDLIHPWEVASAP